jgi:hypothetical protein
MSTRSTTLCAFSGRRAAKSLLMPSFNVKRSPKAERRSIVRATAHGCATTMRAQRREAVWITSGPLNGWGL